MAGTYYYKVIQNPNTGQQVRLTGADRFSLANKIEKQFERWERERVRELKAEKKQLAFEKTEQAQNDIAALQSILKATLAVDDKIDWDKLYDKKTYSSAPELSQYQQATFSKSLSFIGAFKKRAEEQAKVEMQAYELALEQFNVNKNEWESAQKEYNDSLEGKRKAYEAGTADGIADYVAMVLEKSDYPDVITLNYEMLSDDRTGILLVDIDLPTVDTIPQVEAYKYVSTTDVIEAKNIKQKDLAALYDSVQYQIVLRTIHEVFESDYKEHIKSIVVNGNTDIRNRGTGSVNKKTIMTIQVNREEFLAVDLANVDPAQCFRHFKGVTAGSLIELSAVKPIMKLDKTDKRIIQADEILDEFDPTQNLATMKWEEFEVLVRDLVQKEFSNETTTVEVTRASRDAGVDAIAFDDDPIRGGKFVIQAKRYNNLVPVSAVRDLFGTVHNEGAVKGILITTSYYGPDAISFAKDKPLALINGEQLLYLFQKHGYDFKIALTKKHAASSRII